VEPSSEESFSYLNGRRLQGKFLEKFKMLRAKCDTQRFYVNSHYLERLAAFTIDIPAK
jgi:hypothetical protein